MVAIVGLILFCIMMLAGLVLATSAFPWRRPRPWPYAWIIIVLIAPAAAIIVVQSLYGLPAGSCVERPLNDVPLWIGGASLILSIATPIMARGARRFALGMSLLVCPLTFGLALLGTMSLAGCWI
jgi:hypothetical protein